MEELVVKPGNSNLKLISCVEQACRFLEFEFSLEGFMGYVVIKVLLRICH